MGYLAKPHPAWTSAPVREIVDESRKKGLKTPFQVTDVPGNGGSCPLLQTSLPPSTPPCQAKAGRGLGSGTAPSFFHKDILLHIITSIYLFPLGIFHQDEYQRQTTLWYPLKFIFHYLHFYILKSGNPGPR